MKTKKAGQKIYGEKILKVVGAKATSNHDIDHFLITEKNIFAISVIGKHYWNIKNNGLTQKDIEAKYGISIEEDK